MRERIYKTPVPRVHADRHKLEARLITKRRRFNNSAYQIIMSAQSIITILQYVKIIASDNALLESQQLARR